MSRIGKAPISIPQGVTITINGNIVTVKGKLGELTQEVKDIAVKQEDGKLVLENQGTTKTHNALVYIVHCLTIWFTEYLQVLL